MTDRPVALVTGASSGIGAEFARVLAAHGHDLVLVARREAELTALGEELAARHGTDTTVVQADLVRPESVGAVRQAVDDAGVQVDILVNNAGFGGHGPFAASPPDESSRMIAVNIAALTALTREFLPGMLERRRGHVLNVASTAAFQPGPFMAVYYATKAYVLSFTDALAEELSGSGVTATALCPGVVPSGFQAAAGVEGTPLTNSPGALSPQVVAQAGYEAMMRGRRIVVPGLLNKIGVQSIRIAPRVVVSKVIRRLH